MQCIRIVFCCCCQPIVYHSNGFFRHKKKWKGEKMKCRKFIDIWKRQSVVFGDQTNEIKWNFFGSDGNVPILWESGTRCESKSKMLFTICARYPISNGIRSFLPSHASLGFITLGVGVERFDNTSIECYIEIAGAASSKLLVWSMGRNVGIQVV